MGQRYTAKCNDCNHRFDVNEGGGFSFEMLHCEACGKPKSMAFDQFKETRSSYLRSFANTGNMKVVDKNMRDDSDGKPIPEPEYQKAVELLAGSCSCGGRFTFAAQSRCPMCKSTNHTDTMEGSLCYD